jgi:hypothetical protein
MVQQWSLFQNKRHKVIHRIFSMHQPSSYCATGSETPSKGMDLHSIPRLLKLLEAVNDITREVLGKPAPSGPVLQATILAGCPRNDGEDPDPNGMLEIAQAPLENESADYFLKLDGIDGESGGGSGGSGGSMLRRRCRGLLCRTVSLLKCHYST